MKEYSYIEMFQDNNIEVIGVCDKFSDPKGTPFVTLTSGGIKNQGEPMPVIFTSHETAVKLFEDALLVWLNGRRRVYIRAYPEVREITLVQDSLHESWDKLTYYVVTCRITAY